MMRSAASIAAVWVILAQSGSAHSVTVQPMTDAYFYHATELDITLRCAGFYTAVVQSNMMDGLPSVAQQMFRST
ncbi:MAG: hypothetical protein AAF386_07890, partial [Pseudomonadota bacterium]